MAKKTIKKAKRSEATLPDVRGLVFNQPHLTEQHHRKDVDTSSIVERWYRTGVPPTHARQNGWYGVVPQIDYQQAQNLVIRAEQTFAGLPATVRAQFDNDPGEFLKFAADPENENEIRDFLGERGSPGEPENEPEPEEDEEDEENDEREEEEHNSPS